MNINKAIKRVIAESEELGHVLAPLEFMGDYIYKCINCKESVILKIHTEQLAGGAVQVKCVSSNDKERWFEIL